MITLDCPPLPARFAVLADVHGNADALAAVLADMRQFAPEAVLVLGDHVSGPLDPVGTADQLMALNAYFLRGNHDRYLLEKAPEDMWGSDRIAYDALSKAALDWLAEMPQILDFDDVWACHATPLQDGTYWSHKAGPGGIMHPRPMEEIAAWAEGITAPLLLCAHTHLPVLLRLPTGQMLFNPGSVGCPGYEDDREPFPHRMQMGTPAACYAIIDRHGADFRFTQRYVPYDARRMAEAARGYGAQDWANAVTTGYLDD
ncbi:metallophosphoesterase [Pseudooceanicola sp. HF7]|uniref:metallophosphoesterase family protein n=1 Tax=Pseudooceanicola sp. HF7 TaxID=2721560 RepID=UPI001431AA95|nr:metallophosphoesterase family protein [Pseudooceanicola sp. HF7]NIZ10801.1 metallophosphoesterase [Pseudooceanicola sp. HF7]